MRCPNGKYFIDFGFVTLIIFDEEYHLVLTIIYNSFQLFFWKWLLSKVAIILMWCKQNELPSMYKRYGKAGQIVP